jgi:hypothetical protein
MKNNNTHRRIKLVELLIKRGSLKRAKLALEPLMAHSLINHGYGERRDGFRQDELSKAHARQAMINLTFYISGRFISGDGQGMRHYATRLNHYLRAAA